MMKILKFILSIITLSTVILLLYIFIIGYDSFLNCIIYILNGDSYKKYILESVLFPKKYYYLLLICLLIIITGLSLLYININRIYPLIRVFFLSTFKSIRNIFLDFKTKDSIIYLLPFLSIVYLALTIPPHIDEAYTSTFVIPKPFYYCMMHYPAPNNHILHTLILHISKHIHCFDLLFWMRLPAIIISFLSWVISYSFIKKYFKANLALFITGIYTVLYMPLLFSFLSRGYYLSFFFIVICFYASFNMKSFKLF